jgi:hypothetical protein
MATQEIWSPFNKSPILDGDQIFSIARKGGLVICFWKALNCWELSKNTWHASFLWGLKILVTIRFGDWKNSITISCGDQNVSWLPHCLRWPKHVQF